jgi:cellulose synthase/poly-beta-1,6-N-acetylglucosamine synthase-like glycosyltransferase
VNPSNDSAELKTVPVDLELSVIIPARNEDKVLRGCLATLVNQSELTFELGAQWEIIVVNDDSSDGTRSIAAIVASENPGVTLLDAPPLNPGDGSTGKSAACWIGARIARGKRLLFTDADTLHEPGNLSRSLHEAEKYKAALLSYSPRQIVTGFWQRTVMPLVFSELASVYPMKQVNDPGRKLAAANGQFLLVEREAYFAVGGHEVLGATVLEDVALARNIKDDGRTIRFRYAPDALVTRMYRTTAEMMEGWSKNLALLFPRPIYLALWRVLDVLLFFGLPVLALGMDSLQPWQRGVIWLIWLRTLWRFYTRVTRSHFSASDVIVSILGVPLFIYLLVRSVMDHRVKKSVRWKGRTYPGG